MDKQLAVKREKEIIWSIAFSEINNKECFIDLYLDGKVDKPKNKLVCKFLNKCNGELSLVKRGQPLLLRKYAYENILNTYLKIKYLVSDIGINTISKIKNKNFGKIEIYSIEIMQQAKGKYAYKLTEEIGLNYVDVRETENKYQRNCPYFDKNVCALSEKECSVFWDDCVIKDDYINCLHKIKKEKEYQIEKEKKEKEKKEKEQRIKKEKEKSHEIESKKKKQENSIKNRQKITNPTEIKIQILKMNNPATWKFLNDISIQTDTAIDDLITIYERIIKQCYAHKNDICLMNKRKCNISQEECLRHKQFIDGVKANKKNGITVNSSKKAKVVKKISSEYQINIKDFVVRRAVFKCMHEHHHIENVDAVISVDCDGKKTLVQIPAGYCNQCKTYFIMESTYQELKRMGVILCRITDEKNYLKSALDTEMQLAQESVLMQYGYNVSQTEGLSQKTRQKILALLIDNKALSKSEIISYLDFFISQRAGRSSMEIAISKWETDREFVENYRIGEYTKYGVNAIYRR